MGGGVIGAATAFALARGGENVLLLERDRVGAHASGASAGMLAPISESLALGPGFELGLEALDIFPALVGEIRELSGIDPHLRRCGILRVATEPKEAELLRARAPALEDHGCEWVEGDELRATDARLSSEVLGGIWSPRESIVDAYLLTRAYAAAAARLGARLRIGTTVRGLLLEGDRVRGVRTSEGELGAEHVVLCTGAWTSSVEPDLERVLPVVPIKGQMIALDGPEPELRSVIWSGDTYLVPRNGSLRIGSTLEEAGFDVRPTARGIASLIEGAARALPGIRDCAFQEAWAGLRPRTPDHLPLVGPVPGIRGLSIAAGHYRTGILLSGSTALALTDWIISAKLPLSYRPFDPGRFSPRS